MRGSYLYVLGSVLFGSNHQIFSSQFRRPPMKRLLEEKSCFSPHQGDGEKRRRRRQIARFQLTAANGLAVR